MAELRKANSEMPDEEIKRLVDEHMQGIFASRQKPRFRKPSDWKLNHSDFEKKVFPACKKIPKGKVSTYSAIACFIEKPKAFRAVGNALNKNRDKNVPCHRVVKSNGEIGGFAFGKNKKIELLKIEGIKMSNGKIFLEKYLFKF